MPTWDPALYQRYERERTQPARDLLARIESEKPRRIADLGCGPGNSTALLRERWHKAEIIGVDNSPEMIAAARQAWSQGDWRLADIATWTESTPFDLVFSNAALHWVRDHERVFPRLLNLVGRPGVLAVQMPAHLASAVHRLMLHIADDPMWRERMINARIAIEVHRPPFYYDLLRPLCARLELWETEYLHVLEGPEAIVEWIRGTGLRPFLEALGHQDERRLFLERLLAGVNQAYPRQADGRVLFPFRRLFFIAYR
jgi:trans-aconitate 2-methyltransferase